MAYTDPRDSLETLEEELEEGDPEDVIEAMGDVVDDFETLSVETTQMRRDLSANYLSDSLTDDGQREQVNRSANHLTQASVRRGNLLSQIIAYTRGGQDTGREALIESVQSVLEFEDSLRDSVEDVDPDLGEASTPGDITGAGLSLPAPSVVPGTTITVHSKFRNPGDEAVEDIEIDVESSPDSLEVADVPDGIESIESEALGSVQFDVTPTESGVMDLRVTATASRNRSASTQATFFARSPEEAAAYVRATGGDTDGRGPLSMNDSLGMGELAAGGLVGAGAIGFLMRRVYRNRADDAGEDGSGEPDDESPE